MNRELERRAKKIKRRGKRRLALSVLILCAVVLVGGSFIAVLIHMYMSGTLTPVVDILKELFITDSISGTLVVFWVLAVPILLIVLILVNGIRRRKFGFYRRTWEETVQLAVDAEKQAYASELERLRRKNRFSRLGEPDETPCAPRAGKAVANLKEFTDNFRLFAASELHLYYTEEQVREFVAGLAVSHIIILQGISGTGKTSLTYAFGEYIGNPSIIIPVQPMWKERSDLLGYFNEFTKKYNETTLLRKMYEANSSEQIYITVLDEMNIARVEYYFAEFLSLLEIPNPELRYLEVVPDKWEDDPEGLKDGRIKLPENMWFVGTANNDDSTFAISDKVYDRAMIVDLDRRTAPFGGEEPHKGARLTYREFMSLTQNAQEGYEITKRNERRLKKLDEYLVEKFQITFGNRIMRQIRAYLAVYTACGGDELVALDDILAKKVLRKLSYKDLSLMHKTLEETAKYLETLFGEGSMEKCRAYLARAERS